MDDPTYTLRQLCQRNRDGSHATQADRVRSLTLGSRQLREAGFRQMRTMSLKSKHIAVLLERWQGEGLSAGTLKNRLAHLRWWAEKVGNAGVIPADNTQLGIPERRFLASENKARDLGDSLDKVNDPYVRMNLLLQKTFGCAARRAMQASRHLPLLEGQNPLRRSEIFAGIRRAKFALTEAINSLSNTSGREAGVIIH